jgi:predicted dehydrogenase
VQEAHTLAYRRLSEIVAVVALADVSEAHRQAVGNLFEIPPSRRFSDYRELLSKAELDAVVIATPHHLHSEQAIAAAEAGVVVICEKPLAPTLEEASAVLEAVERHRVPLTVIHNFLFTPGMETALRLRREGAIGIPAFGRALSLFRKSSEDMEPSRHWRASREAGGGCLNDTAYHEIYLVEALVGSPVRAVEARVQPAFFGREVDDLALLLLEHENGALSTVASSWGVPGGGAGGVGTLVEAHGLKGSLRVTGRGQELFLYTASQRRWETVPLPEMEDYSPAERARVGHIRYFRETFRCLAQGGRNLPISGEAAWNHLAILEAARRAHRERRSVEVPRRR